MQFTCNGGKTKLAQLVTNATRFVDSVVKLADGIAFDPSVCYLEVGLPVGGCTVLPPNGVLRAPVSVASIAQTTAGAVVRVVGGLFAHA
ncbi:hypothetical protein HS088_TW03G00675 [Tripterygium wilfordii]|uniref:Uncharacterized protein n=1 Tax=Tripterygium wilfordii TaxID=458696 RepID=A0A7J7DVL2_TRIWF|nr:hypothetical protein HS088_TW03G00675 [Tripterygium wilfordii]